MMNARTLVFSLLGAFLLSILATHASTDQIVLAAHDTANAQASGAAPQDQPADVDPGRVETVAWTVFAAALAMSIGLLLFLLRLIIGWVKPPPVPQEAHH